jgi:predicted adenine nucleotide alpha hydrolase (AANH) superfamily ATPase
MNLIPVSAFGKQGKKWKREACGRLEGELVDTKGFKDISTQRSSEVDDSGISKQKELMLLHTCCAPCAAGCIERLLNEDYTVILLYSNSNIFPRAEYEKRLRALERLASIYLLELIVDEYDHERWRQAVRGYENEPERGRRCDICFEYNLSRTALSAEKLEIRRFTTTLSLSPQKVTERVFGAGARFTGYVPINFRKKEGPKRSSEICAEYGLYRQRYCGCEFSFQAEKRNRKR